MPTRHRSDHLDTLEVPYRTYPRSLRETHVSDKVSSGGFCSLSLFSYGFSHGTNIARFVMIVHGAVGGSWIVQEL